MPEPAVKVDPENNHTLFTVIIAAIEMSAPIAIPLVNKSIQKELNRSLTDPSPIPEVVQQKIAEAFWGSTTRVRRARPTLYFYHYKEQCFNIANLSQGQLGVKTHHDIISIAEDIRSGLSRADVTDRAIQRAAPRHNTNSSLLSTQSIREKRWVYAVDLVSRLMCMLDIGNLKSGGGFTGRETIEWRDGSLAELISTLPKFQKSSGWSGIQLEFTARKLDTVAGLKVTWTQNLADHLLLKGEDEVLIFNQAWFLKNQNSSFKLFPDGLVEETLRTLALLFGESNKRSRRWYNKRLRVQYEEVPQDVPLDDCVFDCGHVHRNIEDYSYWQQRLKILNDRFKRSPKASVRQLWNDRRDGNQWFMLWVVVGLTAFFGFIQSIEGALQVYKAFHA